MTRRDKLLAEIRANLKAVRFEDACKVAERLGFTHSGGQGSHRVFGRPDEPDLLNFQKWGRNYSALAGAATDPDHGQVWRARW